MQGKQAQGKDYPFELTSQKEKNQRELRQLDSKRKEHEQQLHQMHKRQKVTLVNQVQQDIAEDEAGPSLALFVQPEQTHTEPVIEES